jgi:hypothetical protein
MLIIVVDPQILALGLAFYKLSPEFIQSKHDSIPQPFSDLVCLMFTQPFIKEYMFERQRSANSTTAKGLPQRNSLTK